MWPRRRTHAAASRPRGQRGEGLQRVNDFVVKFANVNGSGSASANALFAKAVLRMGVAATPRNIFPSQYPGPADLVRGADLRSRPSGRARRRRRPDGRDEPADLGSGRPVDRAGRLSVLRQHQADAAGEVPRRHRRAGRAADRDDQQGVHRSRQRQLFKNIVGLGALSALLDMDPAVIEQLLAEQFKGRDKLIAANVQALHMGRDWVKANMEYPIGLTLRHANTVGDRIFIDGNSAAALGAVYGGATVCAWYPITPSSSLAEAFTRYCGRMRVDKATGKNKFAIVQAEDELASIGMVIGAAWNGARAFTATSGPGISLMQEFIGLAYFAEIPAVIFDVQRAGPSTGMPTRTQQTDITACAYAVHGDTKHVLLIPEDPYECFEFGALAFDLADRLQTPIFVMLDLEIGMNDRLTQTVPVGRQPPDGPRQGHDRRGPGSRESCSAAIWMSTTTASLTAPARHASDQGRVLHPRHVERPDGALLGGGPGLSGEHGAAAEEAPHRADPGAARDRAKADAPTRLGAIYFGSTSAGDDRGRRDAGRAGIHLDLLRLRGFPFGDEVEAFIAAHDQVFVVEQNRDGQMRSLLINELEIDPEEAGQDRALRRHADQRALHRRRDRGPSSWQVGKAGLRNRTKDCSASKRLCHDLPRQTETASSRTAEERLGFTRRDYEGPISTLCAGCGHDSISAAIVRACFELELPPHRIAKLSGIGCSSKTPTYFLGRVARVQFGARADAVGADRRQPGEPRPDLSRRVGRRRQRLDRHRPVRPCMRRGVNMVYIVENNGVYGLTKGQFSATSDKGAKSKRGVVNSDEAIDLVGMALQLGATFVARSFSGDKAQLVPLIEAALKHEGAAFIDCISPCVAFNNHEGSTKSFDYVREHNAAVNYLDVITGREEITVDYAPGHGGDGDAA